MILLLGLAAPSLHLDVLISEEGRGAGPPQKLAELLKVGGASIEGLSLEGPHVEASVHLERKGKGKN